MIRTILTRNEAVKVRTRPLTNDSLKSRATSVHLLKELANIPSATKNPIGVNRVQDRIALELVTMGFEIRRHLCLDAHYGYALEAVRYGRGQLPSRSNSFVTLVGHADTVFEPTPENPIRVDSSLNRIIGPGVLDDKAGLVVGLSALRTYLDQFPQTPLSFRFVSSPNEEGGSVGFHKLFKRWGSESVAIIGLEPAYPDGSMISSRRGNRWYDVRVTGFEGHTGRSNGTDLNAAHEAAVKITKLMKLTHFKKDVRVSVGSINGGRGLYNVICGETRILLDTRFADFNSSEKLHKKIKRILNRSWTRSRRGNLRSQTTFEITDDCPAFSSTAPSRKLARAFQQHVRSIEHCRIDARQGGGASDVNYLAHAQAIMIDGIGAVGDGMHTTAEWVSIPSIDNRALALSRLFQDCEKL